MIVIGHKGAAGLAPGNTRAALQAAIKAGVDWVEFDVRATKDGHIVLSHDAHTLGVTKRPRIISRTTYATLKHSKTFSGLTIPTIAEAFNAVAGHASINIEIKTKGCAVAVVQNIERLAKQGMSYDRFLVSSFSVARLREVHALNNRIPLGLLHYARPYRFLKLRGLRVQAVGFYHRRLPQKAIEQAKLRELFIYAYTINNEKRALRMQARGVQGIVTDRPDRLT